MDASNSGRPFQIFLILMLFAIFTKAMPTLFIKTTNLAAERTAPIRLVPAGLVPNVIYGQKRALDMLDGDGFGALNKRALDVIEGDGFGFEKRSAATLKQQLKRSLDQLEGDDFNHGFRKRSLDSIEGDGFGGFVSKKRSANPEFSRHQLIEFQRLRRALDALEGTSFGF